jgi:hypothetical protein
LEDSKFAVWGIGLFSVVIFRPKITFEETSSRTIGVSAWAGVGSYRQE